MIYVLFVNKEDVYAEVSQTTSYTGAKKVGDDDAYDRIFTTEEDRSQLSRFWNEACTSVCGKLKRWIDREDNSTKGFELRLDLPSSSDPEVLKSVPDDLRSYFVYFISSKWFVLTNKEESGEYSEMAAGLLESVRRKVCHRRRPVRPVYGGSKGKGGES